VPPVRPVKGQIIRLRVEAGELPVQRNLRALAHGRSIYVVARASGEIVVGATIEDKGFDTAVTAGGLHELLDAAVDVLPGLGELEQTEAIARLRPATPDNGPVLGPTTMERLVLATGHHRNGVLLTPITADAIAALLVDGQLPSEAQPFTLSRF
jgi:glycine oxidase